MRTTVRLGWLGPVLVVIGLAVGTLGVWWMFHARPVAGAVIDVLALDDEWVVVVRREATTDRAFVELDSTKRGVIWQALIPHYGGRPGAPGLAAAKNAISVRITRTRPEVWALSTRDAAKLGAIALDSYAAGTWSEANPSAVVTAGDGTRSFEVVDGTGGATIVAIDLERGDVVWHRAIGGTIQTLTAGANELTVTRSDGAVSVLSPTTGAPIDVAPGAPAPLPYTYTAGDRMLANASGARMPWPADARDPLRNHLANHDLWIVRDHRLEVLDIEALKIVGRLEIR